MDKKIDVVIDPGHGGTDSGAVGQFGLQEKNVVLHTCSMIRAYLEMAGINTLMTREHDEYIQLSTRTKISNDVSPALFLSIHCNGFKDMKATGMDVYTSEGKTAADGWAEDVLKAMLFTFPTHKDHRGEGTSEENFYVLRKTTSPAILVEMEFITNVAQEVFLRNEFDKLAKIISSTIIRRFYHAGK